MSAETETSWLDAKFVILIIAYTIHTLIDPNYFKFTHLHANRNIDRIW